MPQVVRTPRARLDLLDIWEDVAESSLEAADRLLDAIAAQCDRLADFPGMGRRRDELAPSLRSFPIGNYVIFYRLIDDGIEVIRVLHGARDIDSFFFV
jgi:toxin ParE1/3/4